MMKWISRIFGLVDPLEGETPLNVFARGEVSARVFKNTLECGHARHCIELMRYFDDKDVWLSAGLVMDIDLDDYVTVLQ